jgi:hypothetical protein
MLEFHHAEVAVQVHPAVRDCGVVKLDSKGKYEGRVLTVENREVNKYEGWTASYLSLTCIRQYIPMDVFTYLALVIEPNNFLNGGDFALPPSSPTVCDGDGSGITKQS